MGQSTRSFLSTPTWVIIVVCLVYLLSPIDVLPDFVPVVGQLDDLAVLGFTAFETVRRVMASAHKATVTARTNTPPTPSDAG